MSRSARPLSRVRSLFAAAVAVTALAAAPAYAESWSCTYAGNWTRNSDGGNAPFTWRIQWEKANSGGWRLFGDFQDRSGSSRFDGRCANKRCQFYQRYIGGLWELKLKSRLFHAFDSAVHVTTDIELDKDQPVRLSYDFNTDPSTCVVYQTDGENYFHVLYEYRIEDGSTEEVCDAIVAEEWFDDDVWFRVTGDATGNNRWSGMAGRLNQYRLIKKRLGLRNDQFVVPKTNPWIADSRTLCNSVIAKLPSFRVHKRCKWTIHDLNFVKIKRDSEGKLGIQKTGKLEHAPKGAESMGHLGDCVRYGIHEALHDFVDIPRS